MDKAMIIKWGEKKEEKKEGRKKKGKGKGKNNDSCVAEGGKEKNVG